MRASLYFGLLAAAALVGCGGGSDSTSSTGGSSAQFELAQRRVARLGYAALVYANDHDDVLPLGPNWMDALTPYIPEAFRNDDAFRSPAVAAPAYGFALNAQAAGQSLSSLPEGTVTIFESNFTDRNSYAFLSSRTNRYPQGVVQSTIEQTNPDPGPDPTEIDTSLARVRLSLLAQQLYSGDYDDKLPPNNRWMDVYRPYSANGDVIFRSPAFDDTGSWGYALSLALPNQTITSFENPATQIAIFDSTLLTRNAESSEATLPLPGRYGGQNAVGFLDGHAEARTSP